MMAQVVDSTINTHDVEVATACYMAVCQQTCCQYRISYSWPREMVFKVHPCAYNNFELLKALLLHFSPGHGLCLVSFVV